MANARYSAGIGGWGSSAGGLPVRIGPDGVPRVALVRVTRKSGVTWEVAKGKLESGEVPEEAAVREVREEMGLPCELRVTRDLGRIRYGFQAPGGLPRLKTINELLVLTQPAHLQRRANRPLEAPERNLLRADLVRAHLERSESETGSAGRG